MPLFYSLIVAHDRNRCIGKGGELPWRSSQDLQWFRLHTAGKWCVVGSRTLASLPLALPHRKLVVLSRKSEGVRHPNEVCRVTGVEAVPGALEGKERHPEVVVIGGAEIYREFLGRGLVRRIYLTELDRETEGGDAFFPELDWGEWEEVYGHRDGVARFRILVPRI